MSETINSEAGETEIVVSEECIFAPDTRKEQEREWSPIAQPVTKLRPRNTPKFCLKKQV